MGLKSKAGPVFFLSLVGVNKRGFVDEYEYIFDLFTKIYDFQGSNVQVISAHDLWAFYESKNKGANRVDVDVFILVEYFVQNHANGHFIIDECPLLPREPSMFSKNHLSNKIHHISVTKRFV